MRLVYRQGNYGSICFPYKDSCAFATKQCLIQCSERFNDQSWFKEIFAFFKTNEAIRTYCRISEELEKAKFNFLAWFDSGDCTPGLVKKVSGIIASLADEKINQIGFTRNEKLWLAVKDIPRVRFIHTVPRGTKITTQGYYAVPNFKKQRICIVHYHEHKVHVTEDIDDVIRSGQAFLRFCGGGGSYIRMKTVTRPKKIVNCSEAASNVGIIPENSWGGDYCEANCKYCFDSQIGCFTRE